MMKQNELLKKYTKQQYKYTNQHKVPVSRLPIGLNADTVRTLSTILQEPKFILDFRLRAYEVFSKMTMPTWSSLVLQSIDLQSFSYFSAIKNKFSNLNDLDNSTKEILSDLDLLDIIKQEKIATDFVIDSRSVFTTFSEKLAEQGIVFCSLFTAIQKYPDLVEKYLGSVVPIYDNYFAALNSAVFSDGSFVFIPRNVTCPFDLSTYFRLNTEKNGQFERTLIICEEGASVSYLEACTAPGFDSLQLHGAVVELIAHNNAKIQYHTVQNWYPGDGINPTSGVYNLVTKRGIAHHNATICWNQVETGASVTWKYPSVVLAGDNSTGEFNSIAVTKNNQQADTGSKMLHIGKNTKSIINAKSIALNKSKTTYRGMVHVFPQADSASNVSTCDSLLLSDTCTSNSFPTIKSFNHSSIIEHEATASRVSAIQLFYLQTRSITERESYSIIISGFCREIFTKLPLEFIVEARHLLQLTLENSIC